MMDAAWQKIYEEASHVRMLDKGRFNRTGGKDNRPTNTVGTHIENQNNIIKQDFKQNVSPDRIAFKITEALEKVAQNPTQSAKRGTFYSGRGAGAAPAR